jgi:hypothetical protein
MKKFIASLLAAAFLLNFTIGCGETPKPNPPAKEKEKEKEKEKAK